MTTISLEVVAEPRWLDETEQQAWRAILVLMNRGMPELERRLKEHGLLAAHYQIFATLSAAPDDTMRLSDLADEANLSQSRLTHRMRHLVDNGDVAIDQDPEDGRVKYATLTKAGRIRLEGLAPLHVQDVREVLFDHIDPEDTECLATALGKIAASMCEHERFHSTAD